MGRTHRTVAPAGAVDADVWLPVRSGTHGSEGCSQTRPLYWAQALGTMDAVCVEMSLAA